MEKPRKYSLQTLLKRRESIILQLEREKERLISVTNYIGWGAGMRRVHVTPSFAKEDRLRERLKTIDEQIKEAKASMTAQNSPENEKDTLQ